MDYELKDKVILITGGASGLGEAIAIKAAAQGARIAIVDRNAEAAEALSQRLGGARGYGAEVGSLEDMERTCRKVAEDFGGLNGAVNNAGIPGDWATVVECSRENWDRVIGVNLTGVFNSLKAELPHILDAGGGSIVNMASVSGLLAQPQAVAYIAAKHGVVGLTKSTAIDFGRRGVRCNAVCPSYVRTPMTKTLDEAVFQQMEQHHPIGRLVTAAEVADVAIFLLSPRSAGVTGSVHLVDGGIAAEFKA